MIFSNTDSNTTNNNGRPNCIKTYIKLYLSHLYSFETLFKTSESSVVLHVLEFQNNNTILQIGTSPYFRTGIIKILSYGINYLYMYHKHRSNHKPLNWKGIFEWVILNMALKC